MTMKRTPLYDLHVAAGARIVDFGGWGMPVVYGSQIEEHHAVRRDAGMFDVSHMCAVDLRGAGARALLLRLLANDVARLSQHGKALYSCMLRPDGGVIDDLIAYYLDERWFRLVVNAGTTEKDLAWIREHAKPLGVAVVPRRDLAMIAIQGPRARSKTDPLLPNACGDAAARLGTFFGVPCGEWFVARTGYTGEDGYEIMLPAEEVPALWRSLQAAGIAPCGLGARDTLRLEAGMNLYGNDMDEHVTPLESGLAWTVALDDEREFIGKATLAAQRKAGPARKLVGLLLLERGVLRAHQRVIAAGAGEGEVTSGTFSPTLERSIALARVPAATGASVTVDIRGRLLPAQVVKPPFVRHGKVMIEI
ncbi:MAG: glycine cleavage system aminomethyltransferase GcvT [Steroidobacteraceae bacterium]